MIVTIMNLLIMMVLFNTCKSSKNYHKPKYNTTKCPGYSSGYYWDRN